jgi:hypothetical protein
MPSGMQAITDWIDTQIPIFAFQKENNYDKLSNVLLYVPSIQIISWGEMIHSGTGQRLKH